MQLCPQVYQFSTKQTEMALRVAALDYLGTVAAHLRRDAVDNGVDQSAIDQILKEVVLIMSSLVIHHTVNVYLDRFKQDPA
jgi:hypothetical protein